MTKFPETVGVVVLTYKGVKFLPNSLPPLLASSLKPRVLVIDSSSGDGTVELALKMGAETLVIPQGEFNHGTTRELGRKALGADIAVMMTQDAVPVSSEMLEKLVRPIRNGQAAVAYARQLPHDGATFLESFPREFNYPATSELRGKEDIVRCGAYTFFCSDSCCAWSNAALDQVGGFEPTLSLEDTIAAAKLIHYGFKISYCADAMVQHSHNYTLDEEFRRYYDIGYVRALHKQLLFSAGGDTKRGAAMLSAMLKRLWRENPALIPYAFAVAAAKVLGYRAGFHGHMMPLWLKRRLSGQSSYWQIREYQRSL